MRTANHLTTSPRGLILKHDYINFHTTLPTRKASWPVPSGTAEPLAHLASLPTGVALTAVSSPEELSSSSDSSDWRSSTMDRSGPGQRRPVKAVLMGKFSESPDFSAKQNHAYRVPNIRLRISPWFPQGFHTAHQDEQRLALALHCLSLQAESLSSWRGMLYTPPIQTNVSPLLLPAHADHSILEQTDQGKPNFGEHRAVCPEVVSHPTLLFSPAHKMLIVSSLT